MYEVAAKVSGGHEINNREKSRLVVADLAIVIPAYKKQFLDKALQSIAQQTNKNFSVYIGDDCSPFNLKEICDKYSDTLTLKYTRFTNNIGAAQLVHQWKRCVNLIGNEKWVWLFSDDDIMDKNCVETFYLAKERYQQKFDVYRFNTVVINDEDEVIFEPLKSPEVDSSENMAFEILMGRRGNTMPDHIFSKEVYDNNNGFVYTEFAQAADWATSILFSQQKGICTLQDAKVKWRLGNFNISGSANINRHRMIAGHVQFLIWTLDRFNYLLDTDKVSYSKIRNACIFNLKHTIGHHYKGVGLNNFKDLHNFYFNFYKNKLVAFFNALNLYMVLKIQATFSLIKTKLN